MFSCTCGLEVGSIGLVWQLHEVSRGLDSISLILHILSMWFHPHGWFPHGHKVAAAAPTALLL